MKNVLLLLILAGLGYAGWHYRDHLPGRSAAPSAETVDGDSTADAGHHPGDSPGIPAPHPGTESMIIAKRTYPALAIQGSAFQQKFRVLHADVYANDPAFLAKPEWPLRLAERTARALGGGVMPVVGTPTPVPKLPPLLKAEAGPYRSALDPNPGSNKKH
jgi:hypothetical protein